jgi:hypothetical protein
MHYNDPSTGLAAVGHDNAVHSGVTGVTTSFTG